MWALSLLSAQAHPVVCGISWRTCQTARQYLGIRQETGRALTVIIVLAALNQMLPVAAILIFARAIGVSLPVSDMAWSHSYRPLRRPFRSPLRDGEFAKVRWFIFLGYTASDRIQPLLFRSCTDSP